MKIFCFIYNTTKRDYRTNYVHNYNFCSFHHEKYKNFEKIMKFHKKK